MYINVLPVYIIKYLLHFEGRLIMAVAECDYVLCCQHTDYISCYSVSWSKLLNVFVCRSVNKKHLFTYQFKQTFDKTFVTVRPSRSLASITEFSNYTFSPSLFEKMKKKKKTVTSYNLHLQLTVIKHFPFCFVQNHYAFSFIK